MRSSIGFSFISVSMSTVFFCLTRPVTWTVQGRVCMAPAFRAGSPLSVPNS